MKVKNLWFDKPLLDLEGSSYMRIENYRGIIEFTEQKLIIKAKEMIYEIKGKKLTIKGVTKREIYVTGEIEDLYIKREAE